MSKMAPEEMAGAQLPRLRPPTFARPPAGPHQITVVKGATDETFKVVVSSSGGEKDSGEVSKEIWQRLWDVFGAECFKRKPAFEFILESEAVTGAALLPDLFHGPPHSDPPHLLSISRAWWYQRYPIFSFPHLSQSGPHDLEHRLEPTSSLAKVVDRMRRVQSDLPPSPTTIYERYIHHLDSYFCLSVFGDSPSDLDILHSWLNDPRVDEFWKDAGDREFHVEWLKQRYEDAHVLPILGSYRGTNGAGPGSIEPFAYYEIYWAVEDKISKAYPAGPFDRGIHMLVGSAGYRGAHRVRSWLPSLVHYIFSDDARTHIIVSEPDRRNLKMIGYLEEFGFKKLKEFDMGHKVAAIMVLHRDHFWALSPL